MPTGPSGDGTSGDRAPQAAHQIGIALTSERELSTLLERIVAEARRFANAEAGALFLRSATRCASPLRRMTSSLERLGESEMRRHFAAEPLTLAQPSLAGYVALTGRRSTSLTATRRCRTSPTPSTASSTPCFRYQTGSVLVVPLQEPKGEVIGVLQLVNARDDHGEVVPFESRAGGPGPGARLPGRGGYPQRAARGAVVQGSPHRRLQPPALRAPHRRRVQRATPGSASRCRWSSSTSIASSRSTTSWVTRPATTR